MAIHGIVGDTVRTSINHYDDDGNPVTGETFTVVSNRPDGSTFTPVIEDKGGGMYIATVETLPTDPTGEWFMLLRANSNDRIYEETFEIDGKLSVYREI